MQCRLDQAVAHLFKRTRTKAQQLVKQGLVAVNGSITFKPSILVNSDVDAVVLHAEPDAYVCRAGLKLAQALNVFQINVRGLVAMDAGLSTGGFTDCLLQRGALRVYGIDVGYGQVHEKIRCDDRVVVMERTNLRCVKALPELVDLVTLDVSFISVLKVMDAVHAVLKQHGMLVVLIKPQFELDQRAIGRGGIVRCVDKHQQAVASVVEGVVARGFAHRGTIASPISGTCGNKEFLACFQKT